MMGMDDASWLYGRESSASAGLEDDLEISAESKPDGQPGRYM